MGEAARAAKAAGIAVPLAGGPLAFSLCDITADGARSLLPVRQVEGWAGKRNLGPALRAAMDRLTRAREPFAGLSLDRPRIMGVVNVTPDSFSDGGELGDLPAAIERGVALKEAGADIIDVGGESTRPGANSVPLEEELRRTIPVVKALRDGGAIVSIDTRHAPVMRAAIEAGATIVNDVTALTGEGASLEVLARSRASVVLMHMRGEPGTMQANPVYEDAPLEIRDFLAERIAACIGAGIEPGRIAVDPGIGFGKLDPHNVALLNGLGMLHELGVAVLLGVSRKSFIGRLSSGEPPRERLAGSIAAGLAGLDRGVQILRVHDVAQSRQALAIWQALALP